ncbi:MAG: thiamine phosphate synthase [Treponema sp.]|nr:thiamine phosphate synthase [Treponema sp.]
MKDLTDSLLLYAVTDRHWEGEKNLLEQTEDAILGGATFVQIREKELDDVQFEKEALELKALCAKYKVPFVVNDNVLLAKKIDADGVHVGQSDMAAGNVREILGPDKILGVSAQTVEEAVLAEKQGADYLGVGAVFPTGSKSDAIDVPHTVLREICQAVKIPVIAIGGITKDNVKELAFTGIKGIAVISALYAQKDIKNAAEVLKQRTLEAVAPKNYPLSQENAVIFDLDGTLLDSMPFWANTAERYLATLGITAEKNLSEKLFDKSLKQGAEYLRQNYSLDKTDDEIISGINDVISQAYKSEIQAKTGAIQFLKELKAKGIKTALATATDKNMFQPALDRLELAQYFELVLTCSECNTSKTEPDIFLKAAERMGVHPKNTWVFEDTLFAIKTASKAGFKTACIFDKSSESAKSDLQKISSKYFNDFGEATSFFVDKS